MSSSDSDSLFDFPLPDLFSYGERNLIKKEITEDSDVVLHDLSRVRLSSPPPTRKIPRPPNSFMIFGNMWRRKLAGLYPQEENKQISVRLGKMWKEMPDSDKEEYYALARRASDEHKKKYPDYVYNPKEARARKALRERSRSQNQRWTPPGGSGSALQPIMLRCRSEEPSTTMLQSYNEGYSDLSYGQHHLQMAPHYHPQPWYNNYIHQEHENGSSDYLGRGEGKQTPDWSYRESGITDSEPGYMPTQAPQVAESGGYGSQEVGPMISQMGLDSPLMGPVLQDPLLLPPEAHNGTSLIPNGVERLEPPQPQPTKEEEESLPKLDGPQATPVENKKDVLKLPGFHQTFGNITEIGRFSQPDEFFESRPPEIPDPPPKVSESLEVKRKPRGRKRKQPEPRELYPRSEPVPCSMPEPQWPPPPPHHWPHEPPHHWHRPHPYYHGAQHYHHPQYQQPPYYHHQHHLDCPPPPPPYHYYQPTPWHPAAREYVHHHSYPGYV